jgi:hypothetical protein
MEDVGIFYGHLVNLTTNGKILCPFGTLCGRLVSFSRFGMLYQEKWLRWALLFLYHNAIHEIVLQKLKCESWRLDVLM